jgi:ABC-type lipoprotein export system ATPase subunit
VSDAADTLDSATDAAVAPLASDQEAWVKIVADGREAVERALADAGIKNPQELAKLQARVAELEEAIAKLPQRQARAGELNATRSSQLGRLGEVRRRKSRLVDESARRLNEALGPRVRVRVFALADRSELHKALEDAVRGQSVRGEQITKLAALDPVDVANAARTSVEAVAELGVTATTANKLVELAPGVIRHIEQVDVPDRVELQINLGTATNEDWKPIDQLSPGQRATALLALAMAAGNEPLIIDQPEDDLDNRYIFAEVVQVLARVCEGRQVIVATHNANIPIMGDAELVVALDAIADRSRVLASGGLEDPEVAGHARQILEGGDEAFRARQRRYLAAQTAAS